MYIGDIPEDVHRVVVHRRPEGYTSARLEDVHRGYTSARWGLYIALRRWGGCTSRLGSGGGSTSRLGSGGGSTSRMYIGGAGVVHRECTSRGYTSRMYIKDIHCGVVHRGCTSRGYSMYIEEAVHRRVGGYTSGMYIGALEDIHRRVVGSCTLARWGLYIGALGVVHRRARGCTSPAGGVAHRWGCTWKLYIACTSSAPHPRFEYRLYNLRPPPQACTSSAPSPGLDVACTAST